MEQKNNLLDEGEGWFLAKNDQQNSKNVLESKVQIDLIMFLKAKSDKKERLCQEKMQPKHTIASA